MKKILLFSIIASTLISCSTKTTVQVVRHPLIQFTYNDLLWNDNSYYFINPVQVVAYPADSTQPGRLYTRYALQAYGKDSKGNNLQLNISFDVSVQNQLVGNYTNRYSINGGLAGVQLFNLDNNNLSYYGLCPNDTSSILQVQKQSPSESLISGNFQMTLCNARDNTDSIKITNGIITDITY